MSALLNRPTLAPSALPAWFVAAAASCLAGPPAAVRLQKPKVLVIDDEEARREVVALFLESKGFDTATVRSTDGPRLLVERGQYDLVILDWVLAGAEGAELLRRCKARQPEIPVIIFSRVDTDKGAVRSELAAQADAVVPKGGPLDALSAAAFQTLERRSLRAQNAA